MATTWQEQVGKHVGEVATGQRGAVDDPDPEPVGERRDPLVDHPVRPEQDVLLSAVGEVVARGIRLAAALREAPRLPSRSTCSR